MRKEPLILILLGALVCLFITGYGIKKVYTTQTNLSSKEIVTSKPEEKILIANTEIFGDLERPPVVFDHKKHVEAIKEEGKKEWETCSVCHREKKEELVRIKKENGVTKEIETIESLVFEFPKKIVKLDKEAYKKAYHDECIGCHKEKLKEKRRSGPITCGECHVRRKELVKIKYPAAFDFKFHFEHVKILEDRTGKEDCGVCHHVYDLKEKKLVYQKGTETFCKYCHEFSKKEPELLPIVKIIEEKRLPYKKVVHQRCISCHIKVNKEMEVTKKKDEKALSLDCASCHFRRR